MNFLVPQKSCNRPVRNIWLWGFSRHDILCLEVI
jgi:hypothetical protein